MAPGASKKDDRIFVQNGRRFYRRKFNATETHIGIFIVFALIGVLVWVFWMGANPDPALFALDADLSQPVVAEPVERGPVPLELAAPGWSEGNLSSFDYDNLYIKINGREGYYKGFGFEQLYFLSIGSDEDAQTFVDIELYDLGNSANAVGAYAGERSEGVSPVLSDAGLMHTDRNALYMTRGRFYLRAIGSDESPQVIAQLEYLQGRFDELPGEPLPWGFALFAGQLGMDPGAIAYAPENALSFGFANNVYTATLDDGSEVFVTPGGIDAAGLAAQFMDGFRQYGDDDGEFVKDRYRSTYARATASGAWVVGVHRAADPAAASAALNNLAAKVRSMPVPASDDSEPATTESVEESYESNEY